MGACGPGPGDGKSRLDIQDGNGDGFAGGRVDNHRVGRPDDGAGLKGRAPRVDDLNERDGLDDPGNERSFGALYVIDESGAIVGASGKLSTSFRLGVGVNVRLLVGAVVSVAVVVGVRRVVVVRVCVAKAVE